MSQATSSMKSATNSREFDDDDGGSEHAWWQDAVIYQIYPRSFADGNGDGMGDLAGVTSRLDYLKALGIDAIWLSPFYRSPQADAGYDVADYRQVDPLFGSLDDFDLMLAESHARDLRVIVDLVPNHTSDEHEWFVEALTAGPGSVARERYIFRDGKGENGELPPNNWQSIFGGIAWTRVLDAAGQPGQWYLHLFDSKQPDLNWNNPEVHAEMTSVLRFWLDRGVDGFRVDVAHGMVKAAGLPDWDGAAAMVEGDSGDSAMNPPSPFFDQEGVHEIYRAWNKVLKEYDGDRMLVAEAWVEPAERLVRYIREDEMQQAFNFEFLLAGWDAQRFADAISNSLAAVAVVGAPSTWVLSNHDTVRQSTRFGLSDPTTFPKGISASDEQPNEQLGLARARAATAIKMALPGSAYVYQGDELGLPEHTTLAAEVRQDPAFARTGGQEIGRDGCRVPLPWQAEKPGYGFSGEAAAEPWLPQPETFGRYAADLQEGAPGSTLELYRQLLKLRRSEQLGLGSLLWGELNDPQNGVLSFENGPVTVLANFSQTAVELPAEKTVLLHSAQATPGFLAPNSTVWLH